MKRKLRTFLFYITLLFTSLAAAIFFLSVPLFNEKEISFLKENKKFWQWPSQHGTLNVHFIEEGNGDQHVLLLHGFRAHTYTWNSLIQPLVTAGYHVWALDLIGFGLSDKPNYVTYDQNFFVEQIKTFMSDQKISSAHVIGNSMGGAIALELALEAPMFVNSITLINALGYNLNMPFYIYIFRNMDFVWGPFLNPSIIKACLKGVLFDQKCVTSEKVEAYCLPYRFPGGTESSLLTMRHFDVKKLTDMHLNFSQIKSPILLIWGEEDTLIPFKHYHNFLEDLPQAQTILIPACGHMPQEEHPELVAEAFLKFATKIS